MRPNHLTTMNPLCNQCNTFHPPLPPGEKCPMAKEGTEDYSQFLLNLRNIISSQIKLKNIKDVSKLFAFMQIECMKIIESYKEE